MQFLKDGEYGLTLSKLAMVTNIPLPSIKKFLQSHSKKVSDSTEIDFAEANSIVTHFKQKKSIKDKVFSFSTNKGGVGKTTISLNLAWFLALNQYKVLCIDLDAQGNTTRQLGLGRDEADESQKTINEVMTGECHILDAIIQVVPNLDFIPANQLTSKMDKLLINKRDVDRILQRIMQKEQIFDQYDFIFFDMHSDASTLTTNAFLISDKVITIVEPNNFSKEGALNVVEGIEDLNEIREKPLDYRIVINKYEDGPTANRNIKEIIDLFQEKVMLKSVIRKSNDFENSMSYSKPIYCFGRSNSNALNDFIAFTQQFLEESIAKPETKNNKQNTSEEAQYGI